MRILLIGEESAALQVLKAIAGTGYEIVAVMTSLSPKGDLSIAAAANRLAYAIWPAQRVKDPHFGVEVKSARIDIILNVHSRYIVQKEVLLAPRIGAFNMHPGPLPEYAGLNTVSWAIYRGESNYGVTVHWMSQEIDAGDIAYEKRFSVDENETPISLIHKCVIHGVPLILQMLETAFVNPHAIPRIKQQLQRRRYFGKQIPQNGQLSWKAPARDVVNFVRACDYSPYLSPWGHPTTRWQGYDVGIARAVRTHKACNEAPGVVGQCDTAGALIACADEWVLVQRLKIASRSVMPHLILTRGGQMSHSRSDELRGTYCDQGVGPLTA
ncbi:MAG: hypothetical protein JOY54_16365 [Acidobacteriaceae bacterium]|nr:hypothetical protein [Acidobacteriaceae bacterium]